MGPSWYWMPDVFEDFYNKFNHTTSDFYNLKRLDPSYRVYWKDNTHTDVPADMKALEEWFELNEKGSALKLRAFLKDAEVKYQVGMQDLVYKPSMSLFEFANKKAGTTTITARLRSDSLQLLNGTSLVVGGVTYPTADGSANQILQTDGAGTLSFATNSPTPAGSNTHVQFNDGGAIAGNSNLVFDKATNRLTVTNLTVNSQFSFTSDYGSIASAVTVTDDFGSTADDTRTPTPHDSYTVTEAGNITGMSAGDMIFVSNETGGATMAFYDGSNWRRVQDRARTF